MTSDQLNILLYNRFGDPLYGQLWDQLHRRPQGWLASRLVGPLWGRLRSQLHEQLRERL